VTWFPVVDIGHNEQRGHEGYFYAHQTERIDREMQPRRRVRARARATRRGLSPTRALTLAMSRACAVLAAQHGSQTQNIYDFHVHSPYLQVLTIEFERFSLAASCRCVSSADFRA
jgi:hypothetical protein